jgi:ATP-binding cassette subfamily C exporter for protease/lipase
MALKPGEKLSDLSTALAAQKSLFRQVIFFSFFTNLLVMTPTLYMLEVYDRVVNSRSGVTLVMLTLLIVAAYAVMEVLEWARTRVLHDAALRFDARVGGRVFDTLFEASLRRIPGATAQMLNDLRAVREFIYSPAAMALIDVPLAMLYIVAIFLIDPMLGWLSIVGALLQVGLAWLTERDTQAPLTLANQSAIAAQTYAGNSLRNAQVIEAMGMLGGFHRRWLKKQNAFLALQADASDKAGSYASVAKFVQLAQSSLLLGAGCWLTLEGKFPGGGGMMIVASTLGGRVLAPIVQVIGGWRQVVNARDAFARVDRLLVGVPLREPGMPLPAPTGLLSVEGVVAAAPGSQAAILRGISFAVPPGKVLALIGPAASGKSTLARLLVGVWPAANGKVRLDGVDIFPWSKAELGPHIGYLPQDVELFDGTLAENIARFGEPDSAKLEAAARAVGVHEQILALPDGYDSTIGDDGCFLSGGLRQRIGLARAIYGNPRLVVLDEPNSNLDEAGEQALMQTLLALKAQGATVVIVTHRTSVLPAVDLLLVLQDGQAKAFGPRDEVLASLQRGAQAGAVDGAPRAVATAPRSSLSTDTA